ncbi:MAG: peptide-methionine (S)-S-oxide reductase MsrA [Leptospirillia bacterium]
MSKKTETATFGAGCFWGVQSNFDALPGVLSTRVGYAGGKKTEPTYQEVCTGNTGHAEVVEVVFDPDVISYEGLLGVFFTIHNPTQLNRQGPDTGTQYRTAIFFHSPEQEQSAREAVERETANGRHTGPIVTEITAATTFWPAEDYHQKYLEKRGLSHCH